MGDDAGRRGADAPRVDDLFYGDPDRGDEAGEGQRHGAEGGRDAVAAADGDAAVAPADGDAAVAAADGDAAVAPADGDAASGATGPAGTAETVHESADHAGRSAGDDPGGDPTTSDGPQGDAVAEAATDHGADRGQRGTDGARRGLVARWARVLAVVGVAGALVYGAGSDRVTGVDLGDHSGDSGSIPPSGTQQAGLAVVSESAIGCLGPDLVGLDAASVTEPEQTVSVYAASAPTEALGELRPPDTAGELLLSGTPEGDTEQSGTRSDLARLQVSGATWARGTATGSLAAGFAGSQVGLSLAEQRRGLTMAGCTTAVDDAWFIAGGPEAGRAERLILANPTGNPVTADVEVFGTDGPVEAVGGRGIVVAPGARHVVLLDAVAPGEERPVVHVRTTGGPVLGAVGDRWLEGTLDRGTELTTATAAPSENLVIPAVPAPRADTADSTTVRVGVPGSEQAVVQVRALTAEGPVRVADGVTNVGAGAVVDIDVSDLPEGTQAIEVAADTPVVAAAQVVRRAEDEGVGELAWLPAVTPSTDLVGMPLAHRGIDPLPRELSVASLEGAVVEVVTVARGATEVTTVEIPPAGSVSVQLDVATESVWVRTLEGSAASALLTTLEDDLGELIAGTPLPATPVTHQVRSVAPWLP